MLRCGLLGETLGHSYSPMIHHELGEYDYRPRRTWMPFCAPTAGTA